MAEELLFDPRQGNLIFLFSRTSWSVVGAPKLVIYEYGDLFFISITAAGLQMTLPPPPVCHNGMQWEKFTYTLGLHGKKCNLVSSTEARWFRRSNCV